MSVQSILESIYTILKSFVLIVTPLITIWQILSLIKLVVNLGGQFTYHKTSLTLPLFIKVPVPSQK